MRYYCREERNAELVKKYRELPEEVRQKLEKSMTRKEVCQTEDISYTSTFTTIHKRANLLAKKWKKTINDVRIEHSCYQEDYSDSYSSEAHLEVEGLETDDQYHLRLAKHYESLRVQEEYEHKEFERLKAKFSNS